MSKTEIIYDKKATIDYVANGWTITTYPQVKKSMWSVDYSFSTPKETHVATNWNDLVDILKRIER